MKKFSFLFYFVFSRALESNGNVILSLKKDRVKYSQALALLKQAYQILADLEVDLTVDSSDFFKALEYFELGQYNKCIPIFKSLIKKNQCKVESMFLLAESFLAIKKTEEACILYNAIVNARHDFLDEKIVKIIKYSYLKLINSLGVMGRKQDACAVIKKYIQAFPKERSNPEVELLCRRYNCSTILIEDDFDFNENEKKKLEESDFVDLTLDSVSKSEDLYTKKKKKKIKKINKI